MKSGLFAIGVWMTLTLAAANTAYAQLETLVMPGEVVEAHAEHEENCDACHAAFDRSKQRELCLDCHEEVAVDVAEELGFHGKDRRAKRMPCARCHTDHEGRDADIVDLDESDFDHDLTDFALAGNHIGLSCGDCHEPDKRYRDAPSNCYACHEADNPHGQTLGTQCGDCHTPNDWMDVEFDHDTTSFPLIGKHQGPQCLDCHADDTFTNTPTNCFDCHAEDDAHDGRSGNECGNCHSPVGWDDTRFDHARDTRFAGQVRHLSRAVGLVLCSL